MRLIRVDGVLLSRCAERQSAALVFQAPPRRTRSVPDDAPLGSVAGEAARVPLPRIGVQALWRVSVMGFMPLPFSRHLRLELLDLRERQTGKLRDVLQREHPTL